MNAAAKEDVYRAESITFNKHVEFHAHLSDAETEVITCTIIKMDHIVTQVERAIDSIAANYQMEFEQYFCFRLVECKVYGEAIGNQELRNTIEQCVIHC